MTQHADTPSQARPLPAPGDYRLDPADSTIRARARAMFGLLPVTGTFQLRSGTVRIAPDLAGCTAAAVIDAGSYASGNTTRDADVTSPTLLDAGRFPDISFTGAGARAEQDGWVLDGSVTAHGVTRAVPLQVTEARAEGGTAWFRAEAQVDRTWFGVTKKKGMVGREVTLSIEARADRA
jgi:polyisoprenoid-binding protein YceI